MKRTLTALLASLLCVGTVLVAAPASASGFSDPKVISPSWDGVRVGFAGPLKIDFSNSVDGDWTIDLIDPAGNQVDSTDVYVNSDSKVVSVPIDTPLTRRGQWQMAMTAPSGFSADPVDFNVVAAMAFSNVTVSPTTFYPRVRDGYRDSTTIHYDTNALYHTKIAAKITNRAGTTVRSTSWIGDNDYGYWTWRGRKNDGTLAPTGDYKITLTGTDNGKSVSTSKWVTVATGHRYSTVTKKVSGASGARAASSGCQISRYDGVMELDCLGSGYARATYGFTIPSNATNLSWKAPGVYADDDLCCDGKMTKAGKRTTSTHYRITVQVTGYRAYDVHSAQVTYTYRHAI